MTESYKFLFEVYEYLKPLRDSLETKRQKDLFDNLVDFIKDYDYESLGVDEKNKG